MRKQPPGSRLCSPVAGSSRRSHRLASSRRASTQPTPATVPTSPSSTPRQDVRHRRRRPSRHRHRRSRRQSPSPASSSVTRRRRRRRRRRTGSLPTKRWLTGAFITKFFSSTMRRDNSRCRMQARTDDSNLCCAQRFAPCVRERRYRRVANRDVRARDTRNKHRRGCGNARASGVSIAISTVPFLERLGGTTLAPAAAKKTTARKSTAKKRPRKRRRRVRPQPRSRRRARTARSAPRQEDTAKKSTAPRALVARRGKEVDRKKSAASKTTARKSTAKKTTARKSTAQEEHRS